MTPLDQGALQDPPGLGVPADEVRALLARTVASPAFASSPRMGRLLEYLVGEWLAGRERRLKEYCIAVSVFGKDASFDPGSNAVVRVEAGRLRRLLGECARGSLAGERLVLDIPKGSYVPRLVRPATPGAGTAPEAPVASVPPSRHHVTVVSCGLCAGPEETGYADDIHEMFPAFREHCARIAEQHGSQLADQGPDRFVAYFGWPESMENAAHSAVSAAVEIVSTLKAQPGLGKASARAGVASGWAVSGSVPGPSNRATPTLLGDVVMTATTLFSHAAPGAVLMSGPARSLAARCCDTLDPPLRLAGGGEAWRVDRLHPWEELSRWRDAAPMVGRRHELDLLLGRWSAAASGEGQAVIVTGEPGIGKSRLVEALWSASQPAGRWMLRTLPGDRGCALAPIRKRIAEAAGIARDDGTDRILDKLDRLLRRSGEAGPQAQALIEALFGFPREDDLAALPASRRKDLTLALLVRLTLAAARQGPLLVAVEDAHWLDPSTRDFLQLLARNLSRQPVLLVVTTRPESEACMRKLLRAPLLELGPLSAGDAGQLVDAIAAPGRLTPEGKRRIVEKAEGIPLFVEELTRSAGRSGHRGDGVPPTLIDLLMTRLDRLGDNRRLAQAASVIGREFQGDFLASVLGLSRTSFARAVRQLIEDDILLPMGDDLDGVLCFRHILLRDAAYESILPQQRRQYHQRIARALAAGRPGFLVNRRPEIVASHLDKAGLFDESAPLWFEAARLALRDFANEEANHHLECGLAALDQIPPADRPKRLEADIVTALGVVIRTTKGYGDPGLYPLYKRARVLCRESGTPEQAAAAFVGCWTYLAGRGEWDEATSLAAHCARRAAQARHANLLLEARRMIGTSALYQGRPATARHWFDKVLARHHPERYKPSHGYDAGVAAAAYSAWALWLQGDDDGATGRAERALAIAGIQNHAPSLALGLGWYLVLDTLRDDLDGAAAHGRRLTELSRDHGFAHWRPLADFALAWTRIGRHQGGAADLALMQSAIEDFRRLWGGFLSPFLWMTKARCHLTGDPEQGLRALDEAGTFAAAQSEHLWNAEVLRLSGAFALADGERNSAARLYRQAVSVARAQGVVAFERRAEAGLAELDAGAAGRRVGIG